MNKPENVHPLSLRMVSILVLGFCLKTTHYGHKQTNLSKKPVGV